MNLTLCIDKTLSIQSVADFGTSAEWPSIILEAGAREPLVNSFNTTGRPSAASQYSTGSPSGQHRALGIRPAFRLVDTRVLDRRLGGYGRVVLTGIDELLHNALVNKSILNFYIHLQSK